MAWCAAPFGIGADDKAGGVHEPDQRDVEAVAHHGEVDNLATGLRRQGAATGLRVVGDDAHDFAVETGEADGCGLAESRLDLEEASAIEDHLDDLLHVVDLGALLRNRSEEHTSELQSLMRISYA